MQSRACCGVHCLPHVATLRSFCRQLGFCCQLRCLLARRWLPELCGTCHRPRTPPRARTLPRERTPPEVREARERERELKELDRDIRTVFAYNLPLRADERDLFKFFSGAGLVEDVRIITDRNTRKSKGFAYIEYANRVRPPCFGAFCRWSLQKQRRPCKPAGFWRWGR